MYTNGFVSPYELFEHWKKHQRKFDVASEDEYLALADAFLGGPRTHSTLECTRGNGEIVRYNDATREFGVLTRSGFILTYFKASVHVHKLPSNLEYFQQECRN